MSLIAIVNILKHIAVFIIRLVFGFLKVGYWSKTCNSDDKCLNQSEKFHYLRMDIQRQQGIYKVLVFDIFSHMIDIYIYTI